MGNRDKTAAEACGIEGKLGEGPTKYPISSGSEVSYSLSASQLMKPDQLLPQNAHEQIEALAKKLLGTYAPWRNSHSEEGSKNSL